MLNSGNQNLASVLDAHIQASMLGRTLSGIVRSELATIEAALAHGIRYEQLCQHLAALGVKASAGTLRQTVYRLRREQGRTLAAESTRASGDAVPPAMARPPTNQPSSASTSTSASATPEPARLTAPRAEAGPPRIARDTVPLLSGNPVPPAGSARKVDFISEIRDSYPDLDLLADRYRKSLRNARQPESAASRGDPARRPSADPTSTPSPTVNPSS